MKSLLVKGGQVMAVLALSSAAYALDDVKMMIPGTPGGGFDAAARTMGKAMQDAGVAKAVSYEHRGGAGGAIGLAQFANASKGDPNAMIVTSVNTVTGILQSKAAVTMTTATPIARVFTEYNVIAVGKASPYKSMKDLMEAFKKDPTSIKWGGGSKGSVDHLGIIELAQAVGVPSAKVNYIPLGGGGETNAAVLGGHVTAISGGYPEIAKFLESGQMRLLAVASPGKLANVEAPTLKELGYNVVTGNWRLFSGAPGITPAQKQSLVDAVTKATASPTWQNAVKTNYWTPTMLTGPELENFLNFESRRFETALKESGLL
ncbi:Bug family tripartite tricarboxylate transporter substrate binding protein [Noviherbaspirillum aerium]|uniref:Bug family tripartite tricarboxylate transporter substrate binding protein n=1 Tax=Noviherbaspirillum aerium TaxID=2588497 RepID=UPI00124C724A|nr:tripartite tricarboxylate transporter substrate-binding protein [Noviherbaspirillum aerium]